MLLLAPPTPRHVVVGVGGVGGVAPRSALLVYIVVIIISSTSYLLFCTHLLPKFALLVPPFLLAAICSFFYNIFCSAHVPRGVYTALTTFLINCDKIFS